MEGAVARHEHGALSAARARADGGAQPEAHRAQPAAGDKGARLFKGIILRRPHLVLPHVRGDARVRIGVRGERGEDLIGGERLVDVRRVVLFVGGGLFQPFLSVRLFQHGQQRFEYLVHVRHHRKVGGHVFVDLRGVDVELDHRLSLAEFDAVARDAVGKAHPAGDDGVRAAEGFGGGVAAVHADHAEELPVRGGVSAQPHQRGADGRLYLLCKGEQVFRRVRADAPAAREDDGALCLCERFRRGGERLPLYRPGRIGCGFRLFKFAKLGLNVFGDVDEHGALSARARDIEGFAHGGGEVADILDDIVVLGDRHGDTGDVHFLKAVSAEVRHRDVAGDGDEGNGIHVRRRDARNEVGRPRPAGRDAHARLSRRARVAVCCVRGALFVRREDVAEGAVAVDGIVNIEHAPARIAENGADALFLQTTYEYFRAADLHCASFCRGCRAADETEFMLFRLL